MAKSSTKAKNTPRIPPPAGGIQVNFCKNPECDNFGVPATEQLPGTEGGPKPGDPGTAYIRTGSTKKTPLLHCKLCEENPPIKSNQGIFEEVQRMRAPFVEPLSTCPNAKCENHTVPVDLSRGSSYRRNGRTEANTQRILCKRCGTTFSPQARATRSTHDYALSARVLGLITGRMPIRRVAYFENTSTTMVYEKLAFLNAQCQAFAADHERQLMSPEFKLNRLYLSTDRQEYSVNWRNTKDKRNIILQAIGTADNDSSYVFGMHLNYDGSIDARALEAAIDLRKEMAISPPFRRSAQIWLAHEYNVEILDVKKRRHTFPVGQTALEREIDDAYETAVSRGANAEAADPISDFTQLPFRGSQIHSEYTMYGHFFFLRDLLANVEKLRFYVDQDSGMRVACLGAFADRIKDRTVDAWYVRINNRMTVNKKCMKGAKR